jgi:L-ribulose-5-phosphate 4-epimerase
MNAKRLHALRREVCQVNQALPEQQLVVMHSGNASGFDPASGLMVIKPSGMDYDQITPENLVEVDVRSGAIRPGQLRPSVDLPHHLFLYRNLPGIEGIVHTHSNHATAFAACLRPIPLCLTAIADEFGGEIPCAPYVSNEGDAIGQAILEHHTQAPAILLGNHGVFAWGASPRAALKAAAMVEDVAKTVMLAMQIGEPRLLSLEEARKWHDRYSHRYGQTATAKAA